MDPNDELLSSDYGESGETFSALENDFYGMEHTIYLPHNNHSLDLDPSSDDFRHWMDNPEEMLNPANTNPSFYPIVATHTITFFVGVIGNMVVIFTWTGKGRLRSPTASFLVSLAVADLLLIIVFAPLEIFRYFFLTSDQEGTLCKCASYIEMLSGMASVLNLVAVSVERFLVIVYPMKARYFCTISKSRKGLLLVWILAMVLAVPTLFTKSIHRVTYFNNETDVTVFYCFDNSNNNIEFYVALYNLILMFIIPGIFMIACYFIVIKVLWSSTKTIERLTAHTGGAGRAAPGLPFGGPRGSTESTGCVSSVELIKSGFTYKKKTTTTTPSTSCSSLATNGTNLISNRSEFRSRKKKKRAKKQWKLSTMTAVPLLREYPKRPTRSTILSTTTNESTEVFEKQHQSQETETSTKQLRPEQLDLETGSYSHHQHITSFTGKAVASLKETNEEASNSRRDSNQIMLQMDKELNFASREDLQQQNLFRRFHHHQDHSTDSDGKNKRSEEGEDDAFHTSHRQTIPTVTSGAEGDLEDDVIDLDVVHPSQTSRVTLNFIGCRKGSKHKKLPTHHHQTAARKQVIKMLLLVIALFLICWGPRLIFNVIVKLGLQGYGTSTYNIRIASYLLSFVHSALNPFVYGLMSSTFRNIILKSCAGGTANDATNGPESCAVSGKLIVGKLTSVPAGTWAENELEIMADDSIIVGSHSTTDLSSRAVLTTCFNNKRSSSQTDASHVKNAVAFSAFKDCNPSHPVPLSSHLIRSFPSTSSSTSSRQPHSISHSSHIEKQPQPVLQQPSSSDSRPFMKSPGSHEEDVNLPVLPVSSSTPPEDDCRTRRTSSQATVLTSDASAVDSNVSLSEP